jgi:hypothetical protein
LSSWTRISRSIKSFINCRQSLSSLFRWLSCVHKEGSALLLSLKDKWSASVYSRGA